MGWKFGEDCINPYEVGCPFDCLVAQMGGHLGINVDIASAVFRQGPMDLIDYLLKVMNARDVRDIERYERFLTLDALRLN